MTRSIVTGDIRNLLNMIVAAIELDQMRVDALPALSFHHLYRDRLWRIWRRTHME
jgi:hypothetical protein